MADLMAQPKARKGRDVGKRKNKPFPIWHPFIK